LRLARDKPEMEIAGKVYLKKFIPQNAVLDTDDCSRKRTVWN